jgi:hypothetical protein
MAVMLISVAIPAFICVANFKNSCDCYHHSTFLSFLLGAGGSGIQYIGSHAGKPNSHDGGPSTKSQKPSSTMRTHPVLLKSQLALCHQTSVSLIPPCSGSKSQSSGGIHQTSIGVPSFGAVSIAFHLISFSFPSQKYYGPLIPVSFLPQSWHKPAPNQSAHDP